MGLGTYDRVSAHRPVRFGATHPSIAPRAEHRFVAEPKSQLQHQPRPFRPSAFWLDYEDAEVRERDGAGSDIGAKSSIGPSPPCATSCVRYLARPNPIYPPAETRFAEAAVASKTLMVNKRAASASIRHTFDGGERGHAGKRASKKSDYPVQPAEFLVSFAPSLARRTRERRMVDDQD